MNNTKDLLALKSTRPDAYETLRVISGSMKYFSPKYNSERRIAMMHTYGVLKIALLQQGLHRGNFLNANYLNLYNRKQDSLAWKCLTRRQIRKWEAKKAAKVA